jgi:ribosomal protein S18 acetylase RimI-like enzyme
MHRELDDSYSIVHSGGELPLSNLGQLELLRGAMERGKPFRTQVRGLCMQPSICDGDVLTLAPIGSRPPAVGEMVAFVRPDTGQLAVHRIIAQSGDDWLIQSDNGAEVDGIVALDQIIGRVIGIERDARAVRFGLGAEARAIAWLTRHERIRRLLALRRLPRRIASLSLRVVQSLALYRTLAHRFCAHITFAEARDEDRDKIQAHISPETSGRVINSDARVTTYVAKIGAELVGYVRLVRNPAEHLSYPGHWLFSLYVWPRYRRAGIGDRLTRRVIEQAEAEGAPELLLLIYADDDPALRLYRQLGFETVAGLAPEPGPQKTSARQPVIMRKALPAMEHP